MQQWHHVATTSTKNESRKSCRSYCPVKSVVRRSCAVFAEPAGVGQGQRHQVLGFELAEAAAEAFGFAEFLAGVGAADTWPPAASAPDANCGCRACWACCGRR